MLTVIAENICGVRPTVPGWSEIEIRPYPAISECDIVIPSVKGMVKSAFKDSEDSFTMKVTIPEGMLASVVLPDENYSNITVNGKAYVGDWKFKAGSYEVKAVKTK